MEIICTSLRWLSIDLNKRKAQIFLKRTVTLTDEYTYFEDHLSIVVMRSLSHCDHALPLGQPRADPTQLKQL